MCTKKYQCLLYISSQRKIKNIFGRTKSYEHFLNNYDFPLNLLFTAIIQSSNFSKYVTIILAVNFQYFYKNENIKHKYYTYQITMQVCVLSYSHHLLMFMPIRSQIMLILESQLFYILNNHKYHSLQMYNTIIAFGNLVIIKSAVLNVLRVLQQAVFVFV